jgi:sugar transferase (PEP-CTERM/EpsH1 system associated)
VRLSWYEGSIAHRYDRCLVVTEAERAELQRAIPHARVEVAPNGVDCERFAPSGTAPDEDRLVFVGVMDYFPNEEGMEFFCREVLPIVRRARPGCTLWIVGARPTRRVRALEATPGVHVTGAVDDVRSYLDRAAVVVVPLRLARGIQNKVLEAMAMARPVVASSQAFEGVDATAGVHALVADDPQAFADAVVELLRDPGRRRHMGRAAREVMVERYSWEAQVARLEAIYATVLEERRSGRGARRSP